MGNRKAEKEMTQQYQDQDDPQGWREEPSTKENEEEEEREMEESAEEDEEEETRNEGRQIDNGGYEGRDQAEEENG